MGFLDKIDRTTTVSAFKQTRQSRLLRG